MQRQCVVSLSVQRSCGRTFIKSLYMRVLAFAEFISQQHASLLLFFLSCWRSLLFFSLMRSRTHTLNAWITFTEDLCNLNWHKFKVCTLLSALPICDLTAYIFYNRKTTANSDVTKRREGEREKKTFECEWTLFYFISSLQFFFVRSCPFISLGWNGVIFCV